MTENFDILEEFMNQLEEVSDHYIYKVDVDGPDEYNISICPIEAFDRWANSRHINLTLYKCWDKEALQQSELVETVKYLLKEIPIKMWCRGMEVNL